MNELEKYSDEEINKEYWRRRTLKLPKYYAEWHYWEGKVVLVTQGHGECCFERNSYKIEPTLLEDKDKFRDVGFKVNRMIFRNKKSMPRLGDIVKLRYRKHKYDADYFDESRIIEIIKRKEDVD